MKPIIAFGDLHGDFDKLSRVLAELATEYHFKDVEGIFLGDVVDGGSKTKECVQTLLDFRMLVPHWKVLLGNHEDLMLNALGYRPSLCYPHVRKDDYCLWYNQGGKETLNSYKKASGLSRYEQSIANDLDFIPQEHLDFIASWPLSYETNSFIFVHAGLRENQTVAETSDLDKLWIRDEFIQSDYDWGKRVVAGHTYHDQPVVHANKIIIDTMHHGHGVLTAVVLDDDTGAIIKFVTSA